MRLDQLKPGPSPLRDGKESTARPYSVLGQELMALGQLDSAGEIHIHGTLKGDVCASRIVLGADGVVEGNLIAREAVLGGRIEGRVFAFNVMVEGTAVIHGNVFHHELTVAAGAHLDGRTPWRPVNYFDDISQNFQGEIDEHVHAR